MALRKSPSWTKESIRSAQESKVPTLTPCRVCEAESVSGLRYPAKNLDLQVRRPSPCRRACYARHACRVHPAMTVPQDRKRAILPTALLDPREILTGYRKPQGSPPSGQEVANRENKRQRQAAPGTLAKHEPGRSTTEGPAPPYLYPSLQSPSKQSVQP